MKKKVSDTISLFAIKDNATGRYLVSGYRDKWVGLDGRIRLFNMRNHATAALNNSETRWRQDGIDPEVIEFEYKLFRTINYRNIIEHSEKTF